MNETSLTNMENDAARAGKIGVLLTNLGTPDGADAASVRRYLKEFLSDKRVIENQGPLWKLVLNGVILPIRPRRKARDYRKIWNNERDESPLKTVTRSQAEKLVFNAPAAGAGHHHGRLGHALRQPLACFAHNASPGARMRASFGNPALSAILRRHYRNGWR